MIIKRKKSNKYKKSKFDLFAFFPFLIWFKETSVKTIKIDFIAAISSTIFALPQGIAFALIAGLPAEFGLYAAIVAPIASAFFGSSWHIVSGPTVATSIVIISTLSDYAVPSTPQFITMALTVTLLAGIIQLLLGLLKLGHIVNFISKTVILGFSTGAAILIISNQVSSFLGFEMQRQSNIIFQVQEIFRNLENTNITVATLSFVTLFTAILCAKFFKKLPSLLVAMAVGSIISFIFSRYLPSSNIEMVGSLTKGLPKFVMPDISFYTVKSVIASSIAIAILGLIQAVSISRTISNKTDQEINPSQEFIGQGIGNIACGVFSGFFSSASFTRTAVNYAAGAKTPLSSIIASGLIILILLFASNFTEFLPKPAMSAIILLVGWKLIDIGAIVKTFKTSIAETVIFFTTFVSTLFLSLEFAIYSGVIVSLIIYLEKTAHPKVQKITLDKNDPYRRLIKVTSDKQKQCPQLAILQIEGALFFGDVGYIGQKIRKRTHEKQTSILLICNGITLIDIAGADLLLSLSKRMRRKGGDLYLSGLNANARAYLLKSPYWQELGGNDNIFSFSVEAISAIFERLDNEKCSNCKKRVFVDCYQYKDSAKPNQEAIMLNENL